MKISAALILGVLLANVPVFAQSGYSEDVAEFRPKFEVKEVVVEINDSASSDASADVEPVMDQNDKVDDMVETMAEGNDRYEYMTGYRIQIYSGESEAGANAARTKARNYFTSDELPIEIKYELPNFKVKAGDFIDKLDAYRWWVKLKEHFGRALLVPERKVKLSNVD